MLRPIMWWSTVWQRGEKKRESVEEMVGDGEYSGYERTRWRAHRGIVWVEQ